MLKKREKEKQNNQNEQEIDQTNYDLARKKSSEISAEKVIEAAYLWYTGALMKYETLTKEQIDYIVENKTIELEQEKDSDRKEATRIIECIKDKVKYDE